MFSDPVAPPAVSRIATLTILASLLGGAWGGGGGWGYRSGSDSWYYDDLWYHAIAVVGCGIVCLASQSATFCGQLRYAYLEHRTLVASFAENLPPGCCSPLAIFVVLVFFPVARVWLFVAAVAYWVHAFLRYRDALRSLDNAVNDDLHQAKAAVSSCQMHVRLAAECEAKAMDAVRQGLRDARQAQLAKVTDFFDRAVEAWAAVGRVTQPVQTMKAEAEKVENLAQSIAVRGSVQEDEPGDLNEDEDEGDDNDETIADDLVQDAQDARKACEETLTLLKNAQNTISESQRAQGQASTARQAEERNSKNMVTAVTKLAKGIRGMSEQSSTAVEDFERLQSEVAKAKMLAIQGEFGLANLSADEVKRLREGIVSAEVSLRNASDTAHRGLLALHLGNSWWDD